jgi:DNA replication protein DnaC
MPPLDLDGMLRRLHLPTVRRLYPELETRAEAEGLSHRDFLALLIAEEIAHRAQTRVVRSVRKAHFPFLRTMEDFDFTFQTSVRLQLLGSYLGPELVSEGRSLILCGPSGTGKTHLAIAIAYRAIQNGFEALFTSAAALIESLSVATRRGDLVATLTRYTHPSVLVIDEVGYLTVGGDAANLMFQVVNERYLHRRPMLFTTNKPLAAWGLVLHDPDLAEAILDRVLERGRLVELRGPSYRTRHLKRSEPDRSPLRQGARISGISGPDFPEPTVRHADHEGGDLRLGAGATGDSLLRAGVFLGDEPAVPTEDRVRGDDARDVPKATPTERLSLHSEAAPLVVSEPEPTVTALRTQHAVFLEQVVDHRLLLAVDPAREQKEEEGERGRQRVHGSSASTGSATLQG